MEADAAGRAVPELHAGGERCRRAGQVDDDERRHKREKAEFLKNVNRGLKFILRAALSHFRTE